MGISCVVYLILGVSCTDEQQLKRSQVSHALAWTLDCGLQKRLTQLSEDPTVIQHSENKRRRRDLWIKVITLFFHTEDSREETEELNIKSKGEEG